jgi:hypothetical protein
MPRPFAWLVFGIGMAIGVLGYIDAAIRTGSRQQQTIAAV